MATASRPSATAPPAPSRAHAHPHDRTLAIATIALLLSGVFDVGRAMYCRYRLSYAVTHSASLLSRRPLAATSDDADALSTAAVELVRRMSGLRDLPRSAVRARREEPVAYAGKDVGPPSVTVSAHYTLPLLSPHVRALFRHGGLSIQAIAVRAIDLPSLDADDVRSAV